MLIGFAPHQFNKAQSTPAVLLPNLWLAAVNSRVALFSNQCHHRTDDGDEHHCMLQLLQQSFALMHVRSCTLCRRRKIRCNRETPCSNCLRSRSDVCTYELPKQPPITEVGNAQGNGRVLAPKSQTSHYIDTVSDASNSVRTRSTQLSSSLIPGSSSASTPASQRLLEDAEPAKLRERIRQLEEQLSAHELCSSQHSRPESSVNMQSTTTRLGGTMHVSLESSTPGQPRTIPRSVVHKTRLLGQSHWAVSLVLAVSNRPGTSSECAV